MTPRDPSSERARGRTTAPIDERPAISREPSSPGSVSITRWPRLRETTGRREDLTWDDLCHLLSSAERYSAELLEFDEGTRTHKKPPDLGGWSPALFRDDRRKKECVESLSAIVFDYDGGATIAQILKLFHGRLGFLHTSFNHTPETPRFRLVLPLSRPISPEEHDAVWRTLAGQSRRAGCKLDESTKDASRFWYLPAAITGAKFRTESLDGKPVDVDELLGSNALSPKREPARAARAKLSVRATRPRAAACKLDREVEQVRHAKRGSRNNKLNRAAFALGRPVAAGEIDRATVVTQLREAALDAGLDRDETDRTIRSGLEAGARNVDRFEEVDDLDLSDRSDRSEEPDQGDELNLFDHGETLRKPTIEIATDEMRVNDEAAEALASFDGLFQRGGLLVELATEATTPQAAVARSHRYRIKVLRIPRLREILAEVALWWKWRKLPGGKAKRVEAHPPDWSVRAVFDRGIWPGIPVLRDVITFPIIRPDGSVLGNSGYDPETGLYLDLGDIELDVRDNPTRSDAREATSILLEAVSDFPFLSEAHRSATIAAILTPILRYAFIGSAPLFLMDANTTGSGKSLLADILAEIVRGRDFARMVAPESDDEFRKRITALALEGASLVLLDNVTGSLGSASLNAALTASSWKDRILGASVNTPDLQLAITWYATGNNVRLDGDTVRRVLPIRLESRVEKPEDRAEFLHPEVLNWVRENRGKLLSAVLTIVLAWVKAGKPIIKTKRWGSFENWNEWVIQPLLFAGLADPHGARVALRESADEQVSALAVVFENWAVLDPDGTGLTAAELRRKLDTDIQRNGVSELRDAIIELAPGRGGDLPNTWSIGRLFARFEKRVVNGRVIVRIPGATGHSLRWRVAAVSEVFAVSSNPVTEIASSSSGAGGMDDGDDPFGNGGDETAETSETADLEADEEWL